MDSSTYFLTHTFLMELLFGLLCTVIGFLIVIPLHRKTRKDLQQVHAENQALETRIAKLEQEPVPQAFDTTVPELEVEVTVSS